MKNKILFGALLLGVTGMFTACSDDNGSNPTLIQPTEFVLNTPSYANQTVDLESAESLGLTWSQPQYTADNVPVNASYIVQISKNGSYTVTTDEASEDKTLTADYFTYTTANNGVCSTDIPASDFNKKLQKLLGYKQDNVPTNQKLYVRVKSYINSASEVGVIYSNIVNLIVDPYYVLLEKAEPKTWYLIGSPFGDGSWGNVPFSSELPLYYTGTAYDDETGYGEVSWSGYLSGGWKVREDEAAWANEIGLKNGAYTIANGGTSDINNLTGYYTITLDTKKAAAYDASGFSVTEISEPSTYTSMYVRGSFNGWGTGDPMTAVNQTNNHDWKVTVTLAADAEFKFDTGSWSDNWGAGTINSCKTGFYGVAAGGDNIKVTKEGTYMIVFNDINHGFRLIKQ